MVTHPLDGAEGGGEAAKEKKKEKKKKPKDLSDADDSGRCVAAAAVGVQQPLQLCARDAASPCVSMSPWCHPGSRAVPCTATARKSQDTARVALVFYFFYQRKWRRRQTR
jgi:hypothetical protein